MLISYDGYNINMSLIRDIVLKNSYISFDINKDNLHYTGILFSSDINLEYRILTLSDFNAFYDFIKHCFVKQYNYDVKIIKYEDEIIFHFRKPYINIMYLKNLKKNIYSFTCKKVN